MNNNEPNKIVSQLFKRYKHLYIESGGMIDKYNWKEEEIIKSEVYKIANEVGAIEVMSKLSILKLIHLQSRLRFMQPHRFYMLFDAALNDITKTEITNN